MGAIIVLHTIGQIERRPQLDVFQLIAAAHHIAVHQYQQPNIDIMIEIIQSGLEDLIAFTDAIMGFVDDNES